MPNQQPQVQTLIDPKATLTLVPGTDCVVAITKITNPTTGVVTEKPTAYSLATLQGQLAQVAPVVAQLNAAIALIQVINA